MLTMQASFLRLKDRTAYKEREEQRIVLKMFVLLYNMQNFRCGIWNVTQMKLFGSNITKQTPVMG
jgi:hypothetical protein